MTDFSTRLSAIYRGDQLKHQTNKQTNKQTNHKDNKSSFDLDIINSFAVCSVANKWLTSPKKSLRLTGVSKRFEFERDSANLEQSEEV